MRRYSFFITAALVLAAGCERIGDKLGEKEILNPERDFPGEEFILTMQEYRASKTFEWVLDENGNPDSLEEETDKPYFTNFNKWTFTSDRPVNLKVSDPEMLDIVRIDDCNFTVRLIRLEKPEETPEKEVTVTLWNGSGERKVEKSVRLTTKDCIELESIHVRVGSEDHAVGVLDFHVRSRGTNLGINDDGTQNNLFFYKRRPCTHYVPFLMNDRPHIEIMGLEPENTSFRTIAVKFKEEDPEFAERINNKNEGFGYGPYFYNTEDIRDIDFDDDRMQKKTCYGELFIEMHCFHAPPAFTDVRHHRRLFYFKITNDKNNVIE